MPRKLLALAIGIFALALSATAEDKKSPTESPTKTLEGKLVCTKCNLAETDKCGNALVVKDGDKDVTYYLNDKGAKSKHHVCSGEKDAKVTGKILVREGKTLIDEPKVTFKK